MHPNTCLTHTGTDKRVRPRRCYGYTTYSACNGHLFSITGCCIRLSGHLNKKILTTAKHTLVHKHTTRVCLLDPYTFWGHCAVQNRIITAMTPMSSNALDRNKAILNVLL